MSNMQKSFQIFLEVLLFKHASILNRNLGKFIENIKFPSLKQYPRIILKLSNSGSRVLTKCGHKPCEVHTKT